jgi:anthranilate synthase component 1
MITELEFKSLAGQGYNRIPLMAEAFADLETPLSLYLKLAHGKGDGKHSFLLESVVGGERFGRYSFIGLPARTLLRSSGFGAAAKTEVVTDGVVMETVAGNPLDFIAAYQQRFQVALRPGLPRFCGGLATSVTTRCATSKRSWKTAARPTPWVARTSCSCSARSWPSSTTYRASST